MNPTKPFVVEFKFPSGRPGAVSLHAKDRNDAIERFVNGHEELRPLIIEIYQL